jgi:hypothetical protein
MKRYCIKIFICTIIALFCLQAFSEDTISVTVKMDGKTAAGIGYSVGGKDFGGSGTTYEGKGPKNKSYLFGYRKNSVKGVNISCGALTLTKNSNVILVTKDNKCHSIIKKQ